MKISLGALSAATPSLKKLLNSDLPIAVAFSLSKLVKTIESEMTTHEEQRQALVKKFGTEDGEGNIAVKPESYTDFFAAIGELNAVEVELNFTPVSVQKLEGVKLSAVDLAVLEAFVGE